MTSKDNGSPINITERASQEARKNSFPEQIKVTTGNLFPYPNEEDAKQRINQELMKRFKDYTIQSISDITFGEGFLSVTLTKSDAS